MNFPRPYKSYLHNPPKRAGEDMVSKYGGYRPVADPDGQPITYPPTPPEGRGGGSPASEVGNSSTCQYEIEFNINDGYSARIGALTTRVEANNYQEAIEKFYAAAESMGIGDIAAAETIAQIVNVKDIV